MDILTNITLFLVYACLTLGGSWLFAHRAGYQKWFYLAFAFAFVLLMLGIWPGFEVATNLGVLGVLITAGVQVFTNVLIEMMAKDGIFLQAAPDAQKTRITT